MQSERLDTTEYARRVERFAVAALAILVACKGKADCKSDVEDLMKFLRTMDHAQPAAFVRDDMHIVQRPELSRKHLGFAPVVEMRPKDIQYQGQVESIDGLGERLVAANAKIREDIAQGHVSRRDPPDPKQIIFLIDAAVTWDCITAVAEVAARAGFTHVAFAFGQPSPVAPPPRTWADDKMEKIKHDEEEGGNRATSVATLMTGIIKDCKAPLLFLMKAPKAQKMDPEHAAME